MIDNKSWLIKLALVISVGGLVLLGASGANVNGVASNQVVLDNVAQQQLDQHISDITGVESDSAVEPASYDTSSVTKQQVIETNDLTAREVLTHKVKANETIETIARDYGVNTNTIKWANDLTSDTLSLGQKLSIPPVDGVLHEVDSGDTVKKLAEKYGARESDIIAFNDAEIDGLKQGQTVIIPNGVKPDPITSQTFASASYNYSLRPSYSSSYNYITHYTNYASTSTYSRGWCTDWAAYRAAQLGNPVQNRWGNANTWDSNAAAAGYYVGPVPKVGAVFQSDYGWAGHVGVVEAVSSDGTMIKYSDMNGLAGWGNAAQTKNWVSAAGYDFIYR